MRGGVEVFGKQGPFGARNRALVLWRHDPEGKGQECASASSLAMPDGATSRSPG
jgi:hypothetical protein